MTPFKGTNRVTSLYGWRTLSGVREFHHGQDIVGDEGPTVRAIWDAERCDVNLGYNGGRGNMVTLYYNAKLRVICQHLDRALVQHGAKVRQGDAIGVMGNTGYSFGAHLHIEVQLLQNGKWTPVDPAPYTEVPNTPGAHPGNDKRDGGEKPAPAPVAPPKMPLYTLTIGPMSTGDKLTLEAQANALGLPVAVVQQ